MSVGLADGHISCLSVSLGLLVILNPSYECCALFLWTSKLGVMKDNLQLLIKLRFLANVSEPQTGGLNIKPSNYQLSY